ncbi:hypothetical protein ACO0LC_14355 [Undibacterium sp. JH2W]|uniref:hypothetical protein n=1 Tax=Undibacterium sp. JH2W TaxID=3413037 RepID=UPI003BF262D3
MSYEFNTESQVFEFPNPYKVENLASIISGGLMLLAGTWVMFDVRGRLAHGPDLSVFGVVAISIILLLLGILLLARAFTQLRYFFGRNRPDSLAPLLANDKDGDSVDARHYKETLRQNAILLKEPTGPLNGLLYSWVPRLIFAPWVIQSSAQTQFYNFLSLAATLISFLFCWLVFGQSAANAWIGLVYGAFTFFQIMRPMVTQTNTTTGPIKETANIGITSLIILIVLAVLGPVVLGLFASHLPQIDNLSINGVVLITLLCALLACAVFGLALKNQLQPIPQVIGAARVVDTVTMNAHPNKMLEELDRILMEKWFSRIPNRKYTRRSPIIEGQQGQFTAEIFEESQPCPQAGRVAEGLKHALASKEFFWLTCLTALAFVLVVSGTLVAVILTRALLAGEAIWTNIALTCSLFGVGMYCYRAAHVLWGRFDFVSKLMWVDIQGSFETASVQMGNQISGNLQTNKKVINIESMSLRVWVSEIDTVIFGRNSPRQLTGMRGLQTDAEELAQSLKIFAEQNSMVVAPTSAKDIERAEKIGMMNKVLADPVAALAKDNKQLSDNATKEQAQLATVMEKIKSALACRACGVAVDVDASFCGECGTRVAAE